MSSVAPSEMFKLPIQGRRPGDLGPRTVRTDGLGEATGAPFLEGCN